MKLQNDPKLNWDDFINRFDKFVSQNATGAIRMKSEDGGWIISSTNMFWLGTDKACNFDDEPSQKSLLQEYSTFHPSLVIKAQQGEGYGREKMTSPPTFASFSLYFAERESEAKSKKETIDKAHMPSLPVFIPLQCLFSVYYVFKPLVTGLEVYRGIEIYGMKTTCDSLELSPQIFGSIACELAKDFQDSVAKERPVFHSRTFPCD